MVSTNRVSVLALALLAGICLSLPVAAAKRTYCCDDAKGRRICGDSLPEQCEGRAHRYTDEKGVVKHVDPPMTAEQKAQREADAQKKKEDELRAAEQRRKDLALLNTYSNEKDIDVMRDRAIAEVEKLTKESRDKYEDAIKRRKGFEKEAEFYAKKPLPDALKARIRENEEQIQIHQKAIDEKKKDIDALRVKFEEEKKRYRMLMDQGSQQQGSGMVHPAAMPRAR